jgi:hypothetical protein
MSMALGLLALALVGAEGESSARANALPTPICYEIRVLEMTGLDWRASCFRQLTPVTRQGSATVWTAGRELAEALVKKTDKVVAAPRVTAMPHAPMHVQIGQTRKLATRLARATEEASPDGVVPVAYAPEPESFREGLQATLTGRKLDQGFLTRLVVDDSQIAAVHSINVPVSAGGSACEAEKAAGQSIAIDVPEVVRASVEGEWLIPNDGILLVSLGVRTVSDKEGKARVQERLMVVEAKPAPFVLAEQVVPFRVFVKPPIDLPMPIPTTPSRMLPQPRTADGTPVALPPLPDDQVTPSSLPGTSEPCASPQARLAPSTIPAPKVLDPSTLKSSLSEKAAGTSRTPVRHFTFHIPLSDTMEIEVRADVASKEIDIQTNFKTRGK